MGVTSGRDVIEGAGWAVGARRVSGTGPSTSLRSGRDGRKALLVEVYQRLLGAYGPQHWWPGESEFEVIVGAILTQSAAWANVEKALANLKAAGVLSPEGLQALDEGEIARLIRPSGYFNAKARKLKAFVETLHPSTGLRAGSTPLEAMLSLPMDELRGLLLSTHGIGPETADSIVLYAAEQPSFVIDAYTRRIFSRIGLAPDPSIPQGDPSIPQGDPSIPQGDPSIPQGERYEAWRAMFMEALPADAAMFNEYHALIVAHGKAVCRKAPRCGECVLKEVCETGRGAVPA